MLPHYVVKGEKIHRSFYSLSGRKLFLYRCTNNGFVNKWCGIWKPPFKFYEYFAFKINDEWLSPQNITETKYCYYSATHKYRLENSMNDDVEVEEILFVPLNQNSLVVLLKFTNESNEERDVEVGAEVAVNIRRKQEEFNLRKYDVEVESKRKSVIVRSDDGLYACYGSDFMEEALDIKITPILHYKEHYPSGELQKCFLPASYVVKFTLAPHETYYLPFVLAAGFRKREAIDSLDACIADWRKLMKERVKHVLELLRRNVLISNDESLNTMFKIALLNMDSFLYEKDDRTYLISGYPWFIEMWGRDNLFSALSLLSLGMDEEAGKIMELLAKNTKNRVPCTLTLDVNHVEALYHGADVSPLFLLVADEYEKISGIALPFIKNVENKVLKSLEVEQNFVIHKGNETWMDSISRGPTAVEIQSMWWKALRNRKRKLSKELETAFRKFYWNNDFMYPFDSFGRVVDASVTPNCMIAALFGAYTKHELKAIVRKMKEELECDYGIRTLSNLDAKYWSWSYHRGSAWGFTTLLGSATCFMAGELHHGIILLRKLLADVDRGHIGFVGEAWNSETGELVGAGAQLWSVSLVPFIVDRFLMGVDAEENCIVVSPKFPAGIRFWKRGKLRMLGENFSLTAAKLSHLYQMEIVFDKKPNCKCKLIMPKDVEMISINDKVYEGNVAVFKPSKRNMIKCFIK